jgi:hypothetical protein
VTVPAGNALHRRLAQLLSMGTGLACGLIAVGLAVPQLNVKLGDATVDCLAVGIVAFIALPVICVITMGFWFATHGEFDFAVLAAVVLAVIFISATIGAGIA